MKKIVIYAVLVLIGRQNAIYAQTGINWTVRTSAADNTWDAVAFGNSIFVALSNSGTGNRVMTSPDDINWTIRTSATDLQWTSVTYGSGLFVSTAINSTANNAIMTSPDGINWTSRTSASNNSWWCVTYGSGIFVAVASSGTGNRVMTSGTFTILPVELSHFSGINKNGANHLQWETATEFDSKQFLIERSADGILFEKIGIVDSKGNGNIRQEYTYTDQTNLPGTAYYRLKQVDVNGSFTYSAIIIVKSAKVMAMQAFPNPFDNRLFVEIKNMNSSDIKSLQVMDVAGRLYPVNAAYTAKGFVLNTDQLPGGVYFLQWKNEETFYRTMVIKNKHPITFCSQPDVFSYC